MDIRKADGVHHDPCRHMGMLLSESDPPQSLHRIHHGNRCSMFLQQRLFSESAPTGIVRLIERQSIQ